MDVEKVTHQREVDKAPGKGLLLAVSLSCLHEVAAPPCYQHRSWEPVRRPAGSASSLVVNWGDSGIATNSSDTGPPRKRSGSSSSPLDMQLISYRKCGNFRGQNIFVLVQGYENKFRENFCTTNN